VNNTVFRFGKCLTHIAGYGLKIKQKAVNKSGIYQQYKTVIILYADIQCITIDDFDFSKCCTPAVVVDKQIVV